MIKKRASGILLHITSLPGRFGVGDLGPEAYKFADWLKKAGQSYWQVLPLNPVFSSASPSPYSSRSAFAGNRFVISPEWLRRKGWLSRGDIDGAANFPAEAVDYKAVIACKDRLLDIAYERFARSRPDSEYERFCVANAFWLDDWTLFSAIHNHFGGRWWGDWPGPIRDRSKSALKQMRQQLSRQISKEKFIQYVFYQQWFELKRYCNKLGIRIIGDVPFFVSYDSADVWARPGLVKLDGQRKPRVVCGAPPDYFSSKGQLWGSCAYNWRGLKKSRYNWLVGRIGWNLKLFDLVRLDHFCGFCACWEVPAQHKTAIKGKWVKGPGADFFTELVNNLGEVNLIAEDLGAIAGKTQELLDEFRISPMRVMLFGFGQDGGKSPHLPHNFQRDCVVYTGTHDNNTIGGWFEHEAKSKDKKRLFDYLGRAVSVRRLHWELIRLAMASVGRLVIIPLQDVLGLGAEARMNRPPTTRGNWKWRLGKDRLTVSVTSKLAEMTKTYSRQ